MIDPLHSQDPVIRHMAVQRAKAVKEAEWIDSILDMYVMCVQPTPVRPEARPIEHYGMLDTQTCGCDVCSEWLTRRAELVAALPLMPQGHKWSLCSCGTCRFIATVHVGFLAAVNRRDLLIETAYHARHSTRHGEAVMGWLAGKLALTRNDTKWSAQELSRKPMEHWLRECEAVVGPQVSGAVFDL